VHAWEKAIRYVEFDYHGEERLLVIGADRHRRMLEPAGGPSATPTRSIHADAWRLTFDDYPRC